MTLAEWIGRGTKPSCLIIFKKIPPDSLHHIASGQWPKTHSQFSQGVYKGKEMESLRFPKSISRFKSDWTWISPRWRGEERQKLPKTSNNRTWLELKAGKVFQSMRPGVWWCLCVTDSLLGLCARDLQLNMYFNLLYLPYVQLSQHLCSHQWVGWSLKVLFLLFGKTC